MLKYSLLSAFVLGSRMLVSAVPEINLIESMTITKHRVEVVTHKDFKQRYLNSDFFAEYDNDIDLTALDTSLVVMPFLMNIITMVWIDGGTYFIESMDQELYHSLKTLKKVFKALYPTIAWKGKLIPRKLVKNTFQGQAIDMALPFSGGLDSTFSSFCHRNEQQLLITFKGQDVGFKDASEWERKKKMVNTFAATYGYTVSYASSNFCYFFKRNVLRSLFTEMPSWRVGAVEGLGWAGLAAPILFTKRCRLLRIAATFKWDYPFVTASNPFVDDNIHFAGIRVKHDGFDFNRIEKVRYLIHHCKAQKSTKPRLQVCDCQGDVNCCGQLEECTKCLSTILSLLLLGEKHQNYGFPISRKEAVKRTKQYLSRDAFYVPTHKAYKDIQHYAQELVKQGKAIAPDLKWILAINFTKKKMIYGQGRQKVAWHTMQQFLPHIVIPASTPY